MKNRKNPYVREMAALLLLTVIYGLSIMITGQACAITFCQPPMPVRLYKNFKKGEVL